MRGPLPVYIHDPVARLAFVRRAMDGLKESKQAVGAATLAAVNDLAPPTVLAQASRLQFSTRLFNLLVTNIPGPQFPLYVLGRQLQDLFPLAFLPKNHALAVAIMSYDGRIEYGLLGDYDALPDIDVIADGIDAVAARAAPGRGARPPDRRPDRLAGTGTPATERRQPILPTGRHAAWTRPRGRHAGQASRTAGVRRARAPAPDPCRLACTRLPFRWTWTN